MGQGKLPLKLDSPDHIDCDVMIRRSDASNPRDISEKVIYVQLDFGCFADVEKEVTDAACYEVQIPTIKIVFVTTSAVLYRVFCCFLCR